MKRITLLTLCIAMLLSIAALSGCTDKESSAPVKTVDLIENGASAYVMIRPDEVSDALRSSVSDLRLRIREKTTVMLDLRSDADGEAAATEIVIGATNRPESASAAEGLGENQFRIVKNGDRIVIVGSNDKCLDFAVDTFADEYLKDGNLTVPETFDRKWQCTTEVTYKELKNPTNEHGNDPFVTYRDGMYYYCWSGGNGVMVSKAKTLDKVSENGGVKVYTAPGGTMYSGEYWAPELHFINGDWYIYVAADDGNDVNHRMWVLKGTDPNDPTKPFKMVGKITDPSDHWAIDGTVLQLNGELYFIWSGWAGNNDGGNQKLYIAHMSDPCTIDSKRVQISAPTYGWEGPLNEGPFALVRNGNVYILYSGNGSWTDDYCIGYLKLTGDDPLKAKSWTKCSNPILSKSSVAYGPGHCSVTEGADGTLFVIYHANLQAGTGWSGRSFWMQEMKFNSNTGDPKPMTPAKTVKIPQVKWVIEGELTG